jgi:uncharacterized protein YndB with AHSA1/START domain
MQPVAKAEIIIRRSATEVFNAFADAEMICKFWLRSTSGPLASGAVVTWNFMVPGASETVTVTRFDPDRYIAFNWSDGRRVQIHFFPYAIDATHIHVTVEGFTGTEAAAQAISATEGFSIVLCDLKTLLESGASADLVRDKAELIVHLMQCQGHA